MTASARTTRPTSAPAPSLFELGYRVRAGAEPLTLIVRNPDGVKYTVNPVTGDCDCPWGLKRAGRHSCKHATRATIKALVLAQWTQVLPEPVSLGAYNRYEDQMFALISAWDAIERAQRAAEFAGVEQGRELLGRVAAIQRAQEVKEVAGVGADGWARLSNVRAA